MATKKFPREAMLQNAYVKAKDIILEIQNAYELCMKESFDEIIPIIMEVFNDPRSGRGDSFTLEIERGFKAWFDFSRIPTFQVDFIEKEGAGYGCFRLKVELEKDSQLRITLDKIDVFDDRRDSRCYIRWDAHWFAQEVANRTGRKVTFYLGGGGWPGPSPLDDFHVKPQKQHEHRSSKTTMS